MQTPTGPASWPEHRCVVPCTSALLEERLDLVLEAADEAHAPVELEVVRGLLGRPGRGAADGGPLLGHDVCSRASESASEVGAAHVDLAGHEQLLGRELGEDVDARRR